MQFSTITLRAKMVINNIFYMKIFCSGKIIARIRETCLLKNLSSLGHIKRKTCFLFYKGDMLNYTYTYINKGRIYKLGFVGYKVN